MDMQECSRLLCFQRLEPLNLGACLLISPAIGPKSPCVPTSTLLESLKPVAGRVHDFMVQQQSNGEPTEYKTQNLGYLGRYPRVATT